MEKNISVACVYQRDTSKNAFPGCRLQTLYSEIKRKEVQHNNWYDKMWRLPRRNAVKCLLLLIWWWYTEASTSVSYRYRKGNITSSARNRSSYFFVLVKFLLVETNWKNQSRPWRFHGIKKRIYHVVIYSSSLCTLLTNIFITNTHWVHSPCPQSIHNFHTDRLWNFVFLMQIIFFMIEGKQGNFVFLIQINSWEYMWRQQQSSVILLSATVAANQPFNWSFTSFHWIQVWATGEYYVTVLW